MKWHKEFAGGYSANDAAGNVWQVRLQYWGGWLVYKNGPTLHKSGTTLRQCKRWIEKQEGAKA